MNATPTSRNTRSNRTAFRQRGDEGLYVLFTTEAIQSDLKTKESGRPVFEDIEIIEIRIPGDDKTIIKTIVSDEHRERFPDEYDAFKENAVFSDSGTPLEHWPAVTKSQVAALKHNHIMNVEDLANLSDANVANIMGGNELKQKAKAFLASANDNALVEKQASEIEELRTAIKALQADSTRQATANAVAQAEEAPKKSK